MHNIHIYMCVCVCVCGCVGGWVGGAVYVCVATCSAAVSYKSFILVSTLLRGNYNTSWLGLYT